MMQRSRLAVSIGFALALAAGASLAQQSGTPAPGAKPAAQAPAKNAKAPAQKAAADRAATQGVKPAATLPSTAAEDRRFKSCHDKDSDA